MPPEIKNERPSECGDLLPHNSPKTPVTEQYGKRGEDRGVREGEMEEIIFPESAKNQNQQKPS